jgi:hypothetical protein
MVHVRGGNIGIAVTGKLLTKVIAIDPQDIGSLAVAGSIYQDCQGQEDEYDRSYFR